MGKWEIRPLAAPKPLNRSSQKVANVQRRKVLFGMLSVFRQIDKTQTENIVVVVAAVVEAALLDVIGL